jgi:antitoxin HicB
LALSNLILERGCHEISRNFEQDEDGVFVALFPMLPGCLSQGKTRAEARANIADAIKGYLESLAKHDEPIPLP